MKKKKALTLGQAALAYWETVSPASLAQARSVGPHTFRNLRCRRFLSEYCWVVYASGFRYAVIEKVFPSLQRAFKDFNLEALSQMRSVKPVLKVFNNERKAHCFLQGAKAISGEGFSTFKRRIETAGVDALAALPGVGHITKNHLAKNIGLADVPKADLWLERAAATCNASSVPQLTGYLAEALSESQHVIDVALWQYGKDGFLQT